jgi:hypothetical protein
MSFHIRSGTPIPNVELPNVHLRKSSRAGVPRRISNIEHRTSNRRPAGGGARTHTALRPLDFESSASASSATPAFRKNGTIPRSRLSSSSANKSRLAVPPCVPPSSVATHRGGGVGLVLGVKSGRGVGVGLGVGVGVAVAVAVGVVLGVVVGVTVGVGVGS